MSAGLKSVLGAASSIPVDMLRGLLGKIDPKFNNYFSQAASRGIDSHRAISYLQDRFGNKAQQSFEGQLEKGAADNTLRPDEMVSRNQVAQNRNLERGLKIGASAAIGGLTAGPIGAATSALGSASQGQSNVESEPTPSQGASTPEQALIPKSEGKSALARSSLAQTAEQMIAPDDLLQAFEQLAQRLQDPEKAYGQMKSLPQYRNTIAQIEKQTGMSFLDWAVNELGKRRQPQQGQQGQMGQGGGNKDQFLSQLGQLSQMLQGLKR